MRLMGYPSFNQGAVVRPDRACSFGLTLTLPRCEGVHPDEGNNYEHESQCNELFHPGYFPFAFSPRKSAPCRPVIRARNLPISEVRCSDPAPGEARERSLVDSPPFLPALSISPSFLLRLHFRRFMIGLNVPVLAKCETDKSEYHQDGSGDHQPMRVLHRGEHLFLRLQP